ncbi:transglutaminase-like domain-containing protein [Criibacterium bergeronii]|uniref:Transglutaminase domain-containing protein n=1 Tax=Criibacterium bergeronii TaxID=1871336 RepID=A0A371IJ69_9FIRM|nr:transglutaminase-like domain-containing protein [Criibacterium bergeronii]MBS6064057.1 transglutaminase domain-containing protein [Peptostreptococcaceae bacterium]RDY20520.1 transglutaminase domain-containing protein [Criibacterium bergeronii]TRW24048.1 transglutaminase domain-containing protein [Criibacterium bergeronii]
MKGKLVLLMTVLSIVFLGSIDFSDAATIDSSKASNGVVTISHSAPGKKLKIIIEKAGKKYTYDLKNDGTAESYPLQMGSGSYKIMVLENVSGTKYSPITTETVNANIANGNSVYLNSIQNVNWSSSPNAVNKAKTLGGANGIYDYVVKNVSYDFKKAATVQAGYNPSIDSTFSSKTGICYDYSALNGGMSRSLNVPTKLVKGYAKGVDGYHAWNEMFIDGKWVVVDTTYDSGMLSGKGKYTMVKNPSDYQKVYEY